MARRRPRSLAEELLQLSLIAHGTRQTCVALERLCPEVAEFVGARMMLDNACIALERQVKAAETQPTPGGNA